jgi:hypothetical protein
MIRQQDILHKLLTSFQSGPVYTRISEAEANNKSNLPILGFGRQRWVELLKIICKDNNSPLIVEDIVVVI